jgi:hypothetical protein
MPLLTPFALIFHEFGILAFPGGHLPLSSFDFAIIA